MGKEASSWLSQFIMAFKESPWNPKNDRFVKNSFAPLRKGNRVRLMIDGDMYFRNLAE